ncbi:MAG: hypothetical protein HQK83_15945 [Fibrobacteria bacterium]|nr:hypothetical protein [Fibrobacteria bacterium]
MKTQLGKTAFISSLAFIFLTGYTFGIQKDLNFLFKDLAGKAKVEGKPTLAILPFKIEAEDMAKNAGAVVAEYGINFFQDSKKFKVVDRADFQKILMEQELAASDLAEPDGAVSMGKLLSARIIITGIITTNFGKTVINAKMLKTETGEVLSAASRNIGVAKWDDFTKSILAEKSQASASLLRSLIVPGWGQYYCGNSVRGTISLLAGLGSLGYAVFATIDAINANTDYKNTDKNVENGIDNDGNKFTSEPEGQAYLDSFYDTYSKKVDIQIIAWSIMGGVWALNMVDASIAGVQLRNKFKPYFTIGPDKSEVIIVYNF